MKVGEMMYRTEQGQSLIGLMRDSNNFLKATCSLSVFFFLSTFFIMPTVHAVQKAVEIEQAKNDFHPQGQTDEEKLSNTLQAIKEYVAVRKVDVDQRMEEENNLWEIFLNMLGFSELLVEDLGKLESMAKATEELHSKALVSFEKIKEQLILKKLPEEILQRHTESVALFDQQYMSFQAKLRDTQKVKSLQDQSEAIDALNEFVQKQKFKRSQKPFDPNDLPFGISNQKQTRQPVLDAQELKNLLGVSVEPNRLEQFLGGIIPPAYAQSYGQPVPADLDPTIDVQMTPAITELANQLDNNPVAIYNWVRNNIEYIPTYGSIQGAAMTLESKRGNAFDTSSLLIALLRTSNTPARYAYGTVRIPVEQVMNWVGGVTDPSAALSLLGQGGIPNIGDAKAGQISHVRLEHIWVEAWVDFEPSKGAKNSRGDSWVDLDASFKQYDYTDSIDVGSQVSFDGQTFADTLVNGATIDDQAGTIQNFDQAYGVQKLTEFKERFEQILTSLNPGTPVNEIKGSKTIRQKSPIGLSAGLPYELVVRTDSFASLSDDLRHKYRLSFENQYGGKLFTRTLNLPEIAGQTLAVNFKPATDQDEQTLQSFVPDSITDISQLPQSVPGYLINLEAELVIENQGERTGARFKMGEEVNLSQALYTPWSGWSSTQSPIVAGEYQAIGVSGAGIGATQLERMQTQAQNVQALLEDCRDNQNCSPLDGLNEHQVAGSLLQAGVLGWFGITQAQDRIVAAQQGVVNYALPSYGKFGTAAEVQYSWGILPRNISFPGVLMDIDYNLIMAEARDADADRRTQFVRMSGAHSSANEHLVPEQLLSTPTAPVRGVSAVKALSVAVEEGQKIFLLTQANIGQLNAITIDSSVRSEIIGALNAGKQVTVHEKPVNHYGWNGSGYIITDQETGSAAYKISGGANGAFALIIFGMMLMMLTFLLLPLLASLGPAGWTIFAVLAGASAAFIGAGVAWITGNLGACTFLVGTGLAAIVAVITLVSALIPGGATLISAEMALLLNILVVGGGGNMLSSQFCT